MKMSDVFRLPVNESLMDDEHAQEIIQSGESHYCLEDGGYWMASNIEHIQAAAHAINMHDELVEMLEHVISTYDMDSCDNFKIVVLLKKARGE